MNKITKGLMAASIAMAFAPMAQAATGGTGIYNTHHDFAHFTGNLSTQGGPLAPDAASALVSSQVGTAAVKAVPYVAAVAAVAGQAYVAKIAGTPATFGTTADANGFFPQLTSATADTPAVPYIAAADAVVEVLAQASVAASSDYVAAVYAQPATKGVGLCTFCHTPHQAISGQGVLWNHTLSSANFTWSDTLTQAGTPFATILPTYRGPSVKCLSCHDGSVAVGDVNLYREGPAVLNSMKLDGGAMIGSGGNLNGNHPIAMPYPMNGVASKYNNVANDPTKMFAGDFVASPVTNGALAKIKLYTDNSGVGTEITPGGTPGKAGIECSSCHDVHNKQSVDDLFLRGKIQGSTVADGYICVQCHNK